MSKTLVTPQHSPGPHENGHDGCHARIGTGGMCPGVKLAEWLNNLGPDDEPYPNAHGRSTNGQVRDNYIKAQRHVVPLDPKLAELKATERRLSAELRVVKKAIKALRKEG